MKASNCCLIYTGRPRALHGVVRVLSQTARCWLARERGGLGSSCCVSSIWRPSAAHPRSSWRCSRAAGGRATRCRVSHERGRSGLRSNLAECHSIGRVRVKLRSKRPLGADTPSRSATRTESRTRVRDRHESIGRTRPQAPLSTLVPAARRIRVAITGCASDPRCDHRLRVGSALRSIWDRHDFGRPRAYPSSACWLSSRRRVGSAWRSRRRVGSALRSRRRVGSVLRSIWDRHDSGRPRAYPSSACRLSSRRRVGSAWRSRRRVGSAWRSVWDRHDFGRPRAYPSSACWSSSRRRVGSELRSVWDRHDSIRPIGGGRNLRHRPS
jgi:hypothetical protein